MNINTTSISLPYALAPRLADSRSSQFRCVTKEGKIKIKCDAWLCHLYCNAIAAFLLVFLHEVAVFKNKTGEPFCYWLFGYCDECSKVRSVRKVIGLLLASVAVIQWQFCLRSLWSLVALLFFLCNLLSSGCILSCVRRETESLKDWKCVTFSSTPSNPHTTLFSSWLAANQAPSSTLGTSPQCYTILHNILSMLQCSEENEKKKKNDNNVVLSSKALLVNIVFKMTILFFIFISINFFTQKKHLPFSLF